MGRRVPHIGVVRVLGAVVHELALGNLGEEKPQEDHSKNALVHGLGHCVPHLVVKSVDFLHSLEVVLVASPVGKGPHTEVVHVRHLRPRVLELHGVVLDELVLEHCRLGVVLVLEKVPEVLSSRFED